MGRERAYLAAMADTAPASELSETAAAPAPAAPRTYGAVNWVGVETLYRREVGRFIKVWMQTILAPVVSTLLFMIVFKLAFPERANFTGDWAGISFANFIAPGLIMMAILNNSFQNTSSSLTIAKVQGSQVDFLMPPLSSLELTGAFIAGAATRGLLVAVITAAVIHLTGLASLRIVHLWPILYFAVCASILMGAVGAMGGIWAEKFDHLAAVSNFVILPLTFLSGTFYQIEALVEPFETLSHGNPFFYLIDGFRYGFLGVSNSDLRVGVVFCGLITLAACAGVWAMFRSGYKLKA